MAEPPKAIHHLTSELWLHSILLFFFFLTIFFFFYFWRTVLRKVKKSLCWRKVLLLFLFFFLPSGSHFMFNTLGFRCESNKQKQPSNPPLFYPDHSECSSAHSPPLTVMMWPVCPLLRPLLRCSFHPNSSETRSHQRQVFIPTRWHFDCRHPN